MCVAWLIHAYVWWIFLPPFGVNSLMLVDAIFEFLVLKHICVSHHSFMCVTPLIHVCHTTHSSESLIEWVMLHEWTSHVTLMNESCYTHEYAVWHDSFKRVVNCMGHITHMNESCYTYEWVMSHIWMSHVTHMNESCHTYEWVTLHTCMSHVTHVYESCYTHEWIMLHIYAWMSQSHTLEWVTLHAWTRRATRLIQVSC